MLLCEYVPRVSMRYEELKKYIGILVSLHKVLFGLTRCLDRYPKASQGPTVYMRWQVLFIVSNYFQLL